MESKYTFNTPNYKKFGEAEKIAVKIKLWTKENDAKLYDYESNNHENKEFEYEVGLPAAIIQEADQLKLIPLPTTVADVLMTIEKNEEGRVVLVPGKKMAGARLEDQVFLVVRSVQKEDEDERGFPLQAGHIVKLGRCLIEVLEYRNSDMEVFKKAEDEQVLCSYQPFRKTGTVAEHELCRICYQDEPSLPLVNVCKCKGSCQYVHWRCLKIWLCRTLQEKKTASVTTYTYNRFECEICKEPICRKYIIDGRPDELFPLSTPQHDPYIILRCFESKERVTSGMINVTKMKESETKRVGRGNQCDLQIIEITVSREHATLKYQDNQFLLLDKKSKFGTLKLLNEPLVIPGENIEIQIGRCLLSISVRNKVFNPQAAFETQCDERLKEESYPMENPHENAPVENPNPALMEEAWYSPYIAAQGGEALEQAHQPISQLFEPNEHISLQPALEYHEQDGDESPEDLFPWSNHSRGHLGLD